MSRSRAAMTAAAAAQMEKKRLPQASRFRNHTSRGTTASVKQHAALIEPMMVIQLMGLGVGDEDYITRAIIHKSKEVALMGGTFWIKAWSPRRNGLPI